MKIKFLLFFIFILSSQWQAVFAQRYFGMKDEVFGQSRIQKKRLEWKTIKSNNFEFNFYRGGEELARKAAKKAEEEHEKITETLGYTPFSVMKIFIYTQPEDKFQTNIGTIASLDLDGKILNLSKARIQIAYQKNDSLFYSELVKEISTIFVYDMLYGGSLKEAVQSQLMLVVPDWYIKGIAGYIAEKNNKGKYEQFKEAIKRLESQKLSHLQDQDAEIIGQSIWHYIATRYGKDNISNILNLTRIIRNEQSSITSTLGVSFNKFLREWRAFYTEPIQIEEKVSTLTVEKPAEINTTESSKLQNLLPGEIDTDFYEFDIVNIEKYKKQKTNDLKTEKVSNQKEAEAPARKLNDKFKLSNVKAYNNLLVSNGNDIEVVMDPVRRLGFSNKFVFNDLLENNILSLKTYLRPTTPFFKNYDYEINYGNYSGKIDFNFSFEKRSLNFESIDATDMFLFRPLKMFLIEDKVDYISRRLLMQRFKTSAIYPLNQKLKLIFNPSFLKTTDIEYDLFDLTKNRDNLNDNYFVPSFEAVYDNTKGTIEGISFGTKAKISFERNINFQNSDKNFERLNLDVRHYQKIVKGLMFASRVNLGRSVGNSAKFTFLGGAENWLNRAVYSSQGIIPGKEGDMRDLLFYNFAGNLRGFEFARLYGNNHLLTNFELRASLAEYFPRSSLSSAFLRNLQFVAFTDVGTAWNGSKGPFSRQNSLNTVLIGADGVSPFFAEVTNFKNPFLMGNGIGLRSSLLGMVVKADYAVGREDKEYSKPRLYISLGKDF